MSVIAIVGLGYVGLPLAVEFGKKRETIGYDSDSGKIESYRRGLDPSGQTSIDVLRGATHLTYTDDPTVLGSAEYLIVAVPTPVDEAHQPDLKPLIESSRTVGRHLRRGATIVYESTVYPGATEEVCIPVLERESGLEWKRDFHIGYSPERINPGDGEHTLPKIIKVVAGDEPATLERLAKLYGSIVPAGIHCASSIKLAEAAKVIENTQRDLNIALMNELAIIFDRIGIDTTEVLEAAETKWNFLSFRPGLVGGHCIGVDPYYLTYKAQMLGYHPQVILAGRQINDGMGKFVAEQTIKCLIRNGGAIKDAQVNVLGLTFKEDCPDLRNSRVIDVIRELQSYGVRVAAHDPVSIQSEARSEYGIDLVAWDDLPVAQAMIAAVPHQQFLKRPIADYVEKLTPRGCFIDVKSRFDIVALRDAGITLWRL
ncbi:MAG: nucleotide sugar dehydrogenase [Acidiferrobacterales bacterium]